MLSNSSLHYSIIKEVIGKGYAPDLSDLAAFFNVSEEELEKALYALQEYHGVVLHPNEPKVWVIHPFSLAPTNFYIKSAKGEWWGNCAWCSLGAASLIKDDLTITTNFGAHDEQVVIGIKDGQLQEKDLVIHFPIPMNKAWENVIYTCSNMLVFRNEYQVNEWCSIHNISKGDIQPIEKVWKFSQRWYGNHLDPGWKKWTMEEAKEIFAEFEFSHPVWQLEDSNERF